MDIWETFCFFVKEKKKKRKDVASMTSQASSLLTALLAEVISGATAAIL